MELYHALPFFFYLLRMCFVGIPPYKGKLNYVVNKFNRLAIPVVTCFIIIWYPFMKSCQDVMQVVHRLFPLDRGIFEDKVSNVWCFINVFVKLKPLYSNEEMAKICLVTTAHAIFLPCADLFIRINKKKFVLCLINVSLGFFLFSFQVHEKSILLVAIPVALHFPEDPFMCFWFLLVSTFSMLPLLIKDGLIVPFIATNAIYISFYSISLKLADPKCGLLSFLNANRVSRIMQPNIKENSVLLSLLSINFFFSIVCMIWLTFASVFIKPPPEYPDLFPLLVSVYSCCHFVFFLFYFNYQQFIMPKLLPPKRKMKTN